MKKFVFVLLSVAVAVSALTGCRANVPQDTSGNIVPTTTTQPVQTTPTTTTAGNETQNQSVEILQNIWNQYADEERFACYGGEIENSTSDAPGSLDVKNAEEMINRYLLPEQQLASVEEGASLVHMMNSNIFTGVAVKLAPSTNMTGLYEAWRDTIQKNRWICGQPDRLLMADVGGSHLLMVFGSTEAVQTFSDKLGMAYPQARVLYVEAIVS